MWYDYRSKPRLLYHKPRELSRQTERNLRYEQKILEALTYTYLESDGDFKNIHPVSYEEQKNEAEKLERLMEKHRFDIDDQYLNLRIVKEFIMNYEKFLERIEKLSQKKSTNRTNAFIACNVGKDFSAN